MPVFEEYQKRLEHWLAEKMPQASGLSLADPSPASSGFSSQTVFLTAHWHENGQAHARRLVFRWSPDQNVLLPNYSLSLQFNVMRRLATTVIPVPRVLWLEEDPAVIGKPFMVMEFIEGEVASGYRPGFHGHGLFFDASEALRRHMWWGALRQAAQLHQLDWRQLGVGADLGNPQDHISSLDWQIEQLSAWLRFADAGPLPVVQAGLDWVIAHRFEPARVSLLWGDARPGNIIYRDGEVAAVLDWELAGIGPPEFDLAYFILADQVVAELNQVPRLPGLPTAAETIAQYEKFAGHKVSNYRYAEIFSALRFAVLLVLVVKMSPGNLSYPADFMTNNIPTHKLSRLLDESA